MKAGWRRHGECALPCTVWAPLQNWYVRNHFIPRNLVILATTHPHTLCYVFPQRVHTRFADFSVCGAPMVAEQNIRVLQRHACDARTRLIHNTGSILNHYLPVAVKQRLGINLITHVTTHRCLHSYLPNLKRTHKSMSMAITECLE